MSGQVPKDDLDRLYNAIIENALDDVQALIRQYPDAIRAKGYSPAGVSGGIS